MAVEEPAILLLVFKLAARLCVTIATAKTADEIEAGNVMRRQAATVWFTNELGTFCQPPKCSSP
jgi:hypothetical protein